MKSMLWICRQKYTQVASAWYRLEHMVRTIWQHRALNDTTELTCWKNICGFSPWRLSNTPNLSALSPSLNKKVCIIFLSRKTHEYFFTFFCSWLSTFVAERIGLVTAVFRGLNSLAIWRRGSVVATDIDHHFVLYPCRWHKKTPSGQRCLGFDHVKPNVTKNAVKVFARTLLKVSF